MSIAHSAPDMTDDHGKGYEPDVKSSDMTTVGIYFVVLTGLFFMTVGGLYLYFRYEAQQKIDERIGSAPTVEIDKNRAAAKAQLGNIEEAMKAVATESKK